MSNYPDNHQIKKNIHKQSKILTNVLLNYIINGSLYDIEDFENDMTTKILIEYRK